MAKHVDKAIRAFEELFPDCQALLELDNSTNHNAYAHNALNVNQMCAGNGSSVKPILRDTVYKGKKQVMWIMEDGKKVPKGIRQVLLERGVDVRGMTLTNKIDEKNLKKVLASHEDFLNEKTLLEQLIESRGHLVRYLPKFHPELNPIENVWAVVKKYLRTHCQFNIQSLRENIPKALESVDVETIRRFFGKAHRFEVLYAAEVPALKAVDIVKDTSPLCHKNKKKSHRRISEADLNALHVGNGALKGLCFCSNCVK